ncbi:MAG: EamA family transporter [Lachnospiraceae bacterium]|nr:EamA family transporter [Lachnospiraceae bacterium]
MSSNTYKSGKGIFYVLMAAILFSIGGLCIKLIPWSPLAINGARNFISAILIGIYLKVTHHKIVINPAVIFGAVCMTGVTTLYTIANKLTTAANTIVLQFTAPIFVIFLMWICFKERPKRVDIIASVAVFAGIICFFVDGLSTGNMLGNVIAVLSGVAYAGVFMMNSFEKSDSLSSIFLGQALSAVTCVWFVFGETDFGATAIGGILALGVFQLALAYIFMSKGLDEVPAVTASLTTAIEPILNPLLVAVFYHETITPLSFVGAVIVIAAVVGYNVWKAVKKV